MPPCLESEVGALVPSQISESPVCDVPLRRPDLTLNQLVEKKKKLASALGLECYAFVCLALSV